MAKFSSQEIESQYNLIKMLLSDPEKYKDAINAPEPKANEPCKNFLLETTSLKSATT